MTARHKKRSLWQRLTSYSKRFSYEVNAPLEDVVENLADLEQEHQLFRRDNQEVSIVPRRDHYTFRLRRRRQGSLAAMAEAELWENQEGRVVIQGDAYINAGPMIILLMVLITPAIFLTSVYQRNFGLLPLVIFFVSAAIDIILLYWGREKVITQIEQAIHKVNTDSPYKAKRSAASRLALADDLPEESDWQDLTGEIEHSQRKHNGG